MVVLQGLFTGLRILFTFSSVLYMPLGDSLTIVFTEPLWTILLSRIILSIKISAWKILFGCLLVCGMVLCVQPPFLFPAGDVGHVGPQYYLGVLLALGTAIMGAMANVCIARCERVSSNVLVFYSGLGGLLIAFICTGFDEKNKIIFDISAVDVTTWLLLCLVGLTGMVGHFSLTRSLRLIPPTTVAVLRSLEIVLAYIVQVIRHTNIKSSCDCRHHQALVMREIPDSLSITGSGLVMVSVVAFAVEQLVGGWCDTCDTCDTCDGNH